MKNNKKIAILGAGKTGVSAYKHYQYLGFDVLIWDENPIVVKKLQNNYNFISFANWDYLELDFIIVSPGIPLKHPKRHYLLEQSEKFNVKIYCDIELFIKENPQIKYVAVTGTNGKSTVTALIKHIFSENAKRCTYAGNIGVPVFDIEPSQYDYIILELSSYQIDLINDLHFNCSLLLNIQEDHIDHHETFENYKNIKYRIFENQISQDVAIISKELINDYLEQSKQQKIVVKLNDDINEKSIYCLDNKIIDNYFYNNKNIMDTTDLVFLKGEHNNINISFAYAVAKFFNMKNEDIVKSIISFKGLKHRQNNLGLKNNITFINDSKATNQESTLQALKAYVNSKNNVYLILGGVAKSSNLDIILPYLKWVKKVFLIGSSTEVFSIILRANSICFEISENLQTATTFAYKEALKDEMLKEKEKYVVLLSPACASFDQFKSFEERGDTFVKIIENL